MMSSQFSVQTFTIRKHLKSPASIDQAFAMLAELGIRAVELAYIKWKPAEIAAVSRASKEHGITIGTSQITFDLLRKDKEQLLEFHLNQLNCQTTCVSVIPHSAMVGDQSDLLKFAQELEQLGAFYKERGLQLCFHHHDYEFRRYGEKMGLNVLMENTSSENVGLVIDSYWAQRGGKTPQHLIEEYAGRVKAIHLRDYTVNRRMFDMSPDDTVLGQGNLDIGSIVKTCCEVGVKFMAIEHATKTPYEDIKHSVEYLRSEGFEHLF